jgi:hypothetical protein
MDCLNAQLLIEAFHDDELEVGEAAALISHLNECSACMRRHQNARRMKSLWRSCRPADHCPDALKRRLTGRLGRVSGPQVRPFSVAFVAAGLGLVIGGTLAVATIATMARTTTSASFASEKPVPSRFVGEVFCLRCALQQLFPETSYEGSRHQPFLKTSDGRLLLVRSSRFEDSLLAPKGCSGRRLLVTGQVYPSSSMVDVWDFAPAPARVIPSATRSGTAPVVTVAGSLKVR